MIVSVQDTGIGISQKGIKNLFKTFGMLDENSSLNKNGIGLGLSICKNLSEGLGGWIKVTS